MSSEAYEFVVLCTKANDLSLISFFIWNMSVNVRLMGLVNCCLFTSPNHDKIVDIILDSVRSIKFGKSDITLFRLALINITATGVVEKYKKLVKFIDNSNMKHLSEEILDLDYMSEAIRYDHSNLVEFIIDTRMPLKKHDYIREPLYYITGRAMEENAFCTFRLLIGKYKVVNSRGISGSDILTMMKKYSSISGVDIDYFVFLLDNYIKYLKSSKKSEYKLREDLHGVILASISANNLNIIKYVYAKFNPTTSNREALEITKTTVSVGNVEILSYIIQNSTVMKGHFLFLDILKIVIRHGTLDMFKCVTKAYPNKSLSSIKSIVGDLDVFEYIHNKKIYRYVVGVLGILPKRYKEIDLGIFDKFDPNDPEDMISIDGMLNFHIVDVNSIRAKLRILIYPILDERISSSIALDLTKYL